MLKSYEASARFSRGIGLGLRDPYPVKTLQWMPTKTQALLGRSCREPRRSGGIRILSSTAGRTTERFPAALRKQKRIGENHYFFDSAHGAVPTRRTVAFACGSVPTFSWELPWWLSRQSSPRGLSLRSSAHLRFHRCPRFIPTTSPGRTGFRCFWKTPGA